MVTMLGMREDGVSDMEEESTTKRWIHGQRKERVSPEHQSPHHWIQWGTINKTGSRAMNRFCRETMSSALNKLSQRCQQDIRWRCRTRIRYKWMKLWKEAMLGKQIWESAASRLVEDMTPDGILRARAQKEKRRKPRTSPTHTSSSQPPQTIAFLSVVLSAVCCQSISHIALI